MLKIDCWLFATFIFHEHVFICTTNITSSSNSTSETNITYTSTETSTTAISNGATTLCTTAVTTTTASTTIGTLTTTSLSPTGWSNICGGIKTLCHLENYSPSTRNYIKLFHIRTMTKQWLEDILIEYTTIGGIGCSVVVAVVVLVTACYYRRTKARKDNRFSDKTNSREPVGNIYNPNVRPSLEWDNPMSITVHSDANAVYATVQKMRPSQSETLPTAYDIMISTMERVPDNTYYNETELLDDTYDSTITYGKRTLDETYDHTNFKTNYTTTDDIYDNTNCTHDNIYDLDAQQSTKEQAYEYTHNNVDEEMNNKPFQPLSIENVDDIYNNM